MELEADRKCGWARRSGGRGRRGGHGEGEGVDGGTIIPNDYPKLKDLLPIIKDVFYHPAYILPRVHKNRRLE